MPGEQDVVSWAEDPGTQWIPSRRGVVHDRSRGHQCHQPASDQHPQAQVLFLRLVAQALTKATESLEEISAHSVCGASEAMGHVDVLRVRGAR